MCNGAETLSYNKIVPAPVPAPTSKYLEVAPVHLGPRPGGQVLGHEGGPGLLQVGQECKVPGVVCRQGGQAAVPPAHSLLCEPVSACSMYRLS